MRTTRLLAVVCGASTSVLVLGGPASAHVTAHSFEAVSGGHDAAIAFRVPNELDTATTTKLEIVLPADKPFAGVLAAPKAGWKVVTTSQKLATPITTDDGTVDTAVSTVTWTATAGGTGPGQYDDFAIAVGQLPVTDSVTFKAVQTYSDGSVARWIEVKAPGATKDPEHPAPVLALGPATDATPIASPSATVTASASAAPATATTKASDDTTAKTLGGAGLGVAVLAALLALAALLRSGRRNPS